ncbi:response regulator transcription factor [Bordetella petrii]|uniref:Two-component system response regulator n=1 Tax=Bordetella petrii (strain ATCC BAA-461 / DSM 12804 / CCUG 43448 / CIP 107267 / Se-1111R) TaxID=340100 RepID=A9I724_BORPD|nr:response regulator transcription factor [Bordetella petrii]CAP44367.1 two-component system response regulator [Bordetella petrii]
MAAIPANARYRVLVVEDDLTIAGNLYRFLEVNGFVPDVAYDGRTALRMLQDQRFDAMVLDVGLPGLDGYQVLQTLRAERRQAIPVLILTARDALDDKLEGFSHGADDYLTKPFALAEVQARLLALIHRAQGAVVDAVREFGPLQFDGRTRAVLVAGQPVRLTRKSGQIVEALLRDPGRIVSREELESVLWGDEPPSPDALRSQMHLLRRALADAGFDGIETVHGIGWRLVLPEARP